MASITENKTFTDAMIDRDNLLDKAIEWIRSNLEPEDVFDDPTLEAWARDRGFI
jgi:hypothetical protein